MKNIECADGPLKNRRLTLHGDVTGLLVPVLAARLLNSVEEVTYRPIGEHTYDGFEIWSARPRQPT